jgi:cobalt transporter subunit CbtA
MSAFRRIVLVAALAGLIAGVLAAVAHEIATVPVILKAEVYEKAAEPHAAAHAHAAATAAHERPSEGWAPRDGLERKAFTALADVLSGIAFALLLASAIALRGGEIDWRRGLYWGLAGFATFTLAPGLGLPPVVPGTEAAPLTDRQIWWAATAAATAGGLALMFLGRKAGWAVAGVALLVLPHMVGAPQPAEADSLAPATLAHRFMVASVVTSLLFWAVLGSMTGYFYRRFGRPS